MKSNELMIGDWVYNKNIDKPIQVYPTMFSQLFRENPTAATENYNIFPIPLTKEDLVKNSFEVQDQGGGRFDVWTGFGKDNQYDVEVTFYEDDDIYVKIDGPGAYFTSWHVKYFHQLQHLLCECGYERKLVL